MGRKMDLSLRRIARLHLFTERPQAFRAVHVAGTNGKGTICFALSRMLAHAGVRWGRYTSPFLAHPSDSVVINGTPMSRADWDHRASRLADVYRRNTDKKMATHDAVRDELKALLTVTKNRDKKTQNRIDVLVAGLARFGNVQMDERLSEFEMQTAVALDEFCDNPDVDVGVVEVGMGGTGDATNIMREKTVTVISRIDLDHTEHLGHDLVDIAKAKAGIIYHRAPCVIDGRNDPHVITTLVAQARRVNTPFYVTNNWDTLPRHVTQNMTLIEATCRQMGLQPYQIDNLWCAYLAARLTLDKMRIMDWEAWMSHDNLVQIVKDVATVLPPGRLQLVNLPKKYGHAVPIIVDGAHNNLGAKVLGQALAQNRGANTPVTWIVALSQSEGKDPAQFMSNLPFQPGDNFAAIRYRTLDDSVPPPVAPAQLLDGIGAKVGSLAADALYPGEGIMSDGLLLWAARRARGGPIVVTGSLYMIRDLFQLVGPPDPEPELTARLMVPPSHLGWK